MKKVILLFTVIVGILSAKPCMTDIYFGNGVWNDKDDAEDNKNSLRKFMLFHANTRLNPNQEGVDYNFKYAHNPSYSYIEDLIETYWQLHQSGQIPYPFFYTISSILSQMAGNITENEIREKIGQAVSHYNDDVVSMLHTYRDESFSKRHNVLLVAHSQGNLWGNKMYTYFSNKEKKKFRMISVATPAAYVLNIGQTSPYVTASGDAVIGSIPNSLPGNVDGLGHEFVDTYLAGSINAPRKIASYVKTAYDDLREKATCDTYQYYVWITYYCHSDQALVVDIYGRPSDAPFPYKKELIATDKRKKIPLDKNDQCPISGNDILSFHEEYDKNGCLAYSLADTTGNIHTIDQIATTTYENGTLCTRYQMDPKIAATLKEMQE